MQTRTDLVNLLVSPNPIYQGALIDHLSTLQSEGLVPSAKQLRLITQLADEAGLDEAGICALVELASYSELTGGRGGTASSAINALRAV